MKVLWIFLSTVKENENQVIKITQINSNLGSWWKGKTAAFEKNLRTLGAE